MQNETAAALGAAQQGVNYARSMGWPVPARYDQAAEMHAEATRISKEPPPTPPTVTDPKKLAKALTDYAAARGQHATITEAATAFAESAALDQIVAHRGALPGWIDALTTEFATTAEQFITADRSAPRELSGYDDTDQVAAFVTARRTAGQLDNLLRTRIDLGLGVAEPHTHAGLLWMAIDPPREAEAERIQILTELVKEYRTREWLGQEAVTRWHQITTLAAIALPPLNQVVHRVERWERLRGQASGSPLLSPQGQAERKAGEQQRIDTMNARRAAAKAEHDANAAAVHRDRQLAAGR